MLRFPYRRVTTPLPVPSLGGVSYRHVPLILVGIEGPQGTRALLSRLDCGADDTIFPLWLASLLGIDLSNAPAGAASGVGSAGLVYRYAQVTLRISDGQESCSWSAMVGFLDLPRRTGLLGLTGFLQYFDAKLLGLAEEAHLEPNASFPGQHVVHGTGP
jgi:hypothetical protein